MRTRTVITIGLQLVASALVAHPAEQGPTRACSELLAVDLGDVGGSGSRVTSAAQERGVAPDAVIARSPGQEARSRPAFPYPAVARYDGKGDSHEASSYVRAAPLHSGESPDWAGSGFYRP